MLHSQSSSRSSGSIASHACETCRERKTRCDRVIPRCRRCARLDQPCGYSQALQPRRTRDDQLQELQDRLARTEAQLALATSSPLPQQYVSRTATVAMTPRTKLQDSNVTNDSHISSELGTRINTSIGASIGDVNMLDTEIGMGVLQDLDWTSQLPAFEPLADNLFDRLSPIPVSIFNTEDEISANELKAMQMGYFDSVYYSFPFINQDRFLAQSPVSSPGVKALGYALALAGCADSKAHVDKKAKYYALARDYCEKCEREGQIKDINLLQALVLLGRFEAMEGKTEGSWITLSRAGIISRLMKLHRMDEANERTGAGSSITTEPLLAEEQRRTFWALYILECYLRTRTGWPCTGDKNETYNIRLPAPGILRAELAPIEMPFLADADPSCADEISSYAGCVLMVDLALRCFDHAQGPKLQGFWDEYCALAKKADDLVVILKPHLNAESIRGDPVAFSLYLSLRATEIFCHETVISHGATQNLPSFLVTQSQHRATAAAFQISNAVRLNLPSPGEPENDILMLQAMFVAWPLTMALKAFYRELVRGENSEIVNGVVASSRLLFAALGHIEETGGHWHRCVEHIDVKLREWEQSVGSLTM